MLYKSKLELMACVHFRMKSR